MACREGVILAFGGVGETTQAVQLAVVVELVAATCQDLVGIGLMAHVPHQTIIRRVKHIVQCHHYLNGTHARCEMAWVAR